jgi:hypothetical protein
VTDPLLPVVPVPDAVLPLGLVIVTDTVAP